MLDVAVAVGGTGLRPRSTRARSVRQIGAVLVPIAVLAVLGLRAGTGASQQALSELTPSELLAALGLGVLATTASAGRWCLVARAVGVSLPLGQATREVYRSTLLNSVLPAGVLGDVHRALAQRRHDGTNGMLAVALERVAGQVVIATAAVVVAAPAIGATVLRPIASSGTLVPAAPAAAGAVLAGGIAATLVAHRRRARLGQLVAQVLRPLRIVVLDTRRGPAVVLLSLIAFVSYLGLFALATRAAGIELRWVEVVPLLALCLLATAIPLNIGGWGPREAGCTAAFAALGVPPEQGLAVGVLYGVLSLVAALPGLAALVPARATANRGMRRLPTQAT